VNGTLEGHERRAIEERLATCPSCRAELPREPSSAAPAAALEKLRAHGKVRLAEPSADK
jgi:hypothetical protein